MRKHVVRGSRLTLAMIAVVLATAPPASAKVPPFTVDITPESPTAGEEFEVTVRFWDDSAHTRPAAWPDTRRFDDFLLMRPAGPRVASAEAISIDLLRDEVGVYRAAVVLPSSGRWNVCTRATLPCAAAGPGPVPGYPGRLEITVLDVTTAPEVSSSAAPSSEAQDADPGEASAAPVATAAVVAVVVAGAVGLRRSRRS